MYQTIKTYFEKLSDPNKYVQDEAFQYILSVTEKEVNWAYEVWDQLKKDLTNHDHHRRARAAQFLCNLAKSDPENRMLKDFRSVVEVTKDKSSVAARNALQSLWKIGLGGTLQKEIVTLHLVNRFISCKSEQNYTLIRYDIIQGLRKLYDHVQDEIIKDAALRLIESEEDLEYRKKYGAEWKNV
ncbi:hypothetical protein H5P36_17300 [Bacillus sp. APMAM]|nr:hypothetical protein [Bacillus sp. APMAM]RTZ54695.1 hypothetical protein EKO25_16530 [Bacillus sp. SAJ1]